MPRPSVPRQLRQLVSTALIATLVLIGSALLAGHADAITWPSRPAPTGPSVVNSASYLKSDGAYYFQSPSGNISCAIRPNESGWFGLGCQTRVSVKPATGTWCSNAPNNKYMVGIDAAGVVTHRCTSQGLYTAPSAGFLLYGSTLSVGGNVCTSMRSGVACWRSPRTSGGFLIARDVNTILR